jgi:protease-4
VKDSFDQFHGLVRERRKLGDEQVKAVADGRVVTGRQARALGLVDELGGEDEARAWLEREKKIARGVKVRDIDPKDAFDWSELFGGVFGWRREIGARLALDGLISLWHPALK